MATRFPEISGEKIEKFVEKVVKNTAKATNTWMNVWKLWAESKDLNDDIVKNKAKELDECHSRFFAEICQSESSLPVQNNQTVAPACQTVLLHFSFLSWNYFMLFAFNGLYWFCKKMSVFFFINVERLLRMQMPVFVFFHRNEIKVSFVLPNMF